MSRPSFCAERLLFEHDSGSCIAFRPYLQVLPLVLELGQDIIWRVRRAVMVSVPLLTERMGVTYFEENLLELYLQVKVARAAVYSFCPYVTRGCLQCLRFCLNLRPPTYDPSSNRLTGTA